MEFGGDVGGGGYIIEAGNLITIEHKAVESVNKFALNVIQHEVRDNFDPKVDEEENFTKLQKSLMNVL